MSMRWPSTMIRFDLPPIQSEPSMTFTLCPAFASRAAVARPLMPAPITTIDFWLKGKDLRPWQKQAELRLPLLQCMGRRSKADIAFDQFQELVF